MSKKPDHHAAPAAPAAPAATAPAAPPAAEQPPKATAKTAAAERLADGRIVLHHPKHGRCQVGAWQADEFRAAGWKDAP